MSPSACPERTLASSADPYERSVALVELGRLREAQDEAEQGLAATGDPKFRLTLAWIALDRGDATACLEHLNAAQLTGRDLARAHTLRGLVRCQQGDPRLAIRSLSRSVRELRRYGDHRWLANALIGRGIARCYAVRPAPADADFTAARALLLDLGELDRAAMCLHNKGFAAMLRGDLPLALRHYEQAAREGLRATRRPEALIDRAEALLSAGLVREARSVLQPAVALLDRCDRGSRLPEALLLAGRCALRDNDFGAALALAQRAAALFESQDRVAWVPVAQAVALQAGGAGSPTDVADACDRHGHHDDAAELRLVHAPERALRHRGTSRSRAIGWLARARLAGTRRAAVAACRAGLALHDANTWPGTELADIALGHAVAAGDGRAVLRWSERRRADPPAPAPETAEALSALRLARARDDHDEIVRLEREIRRVSLIAGTAQRADLPLTALVDALGDKAMLSFVSHRGRLAAVSVINRRVRLHDLGDAAAIARQVRSLTLAPHALPALDRLVTPAGNRPVVIVPSPELDRMPWSALPSCQGRPISVAPSATCWHQATRRPLAAGAKLWTTGPNLTHATREVALLHSHYGGTTTSTVDSTLDAMNQADVAHIAAHGVYRADQPLFSHLTLDDGPLHGYDFDRLTSTPSVVVLSACDSGLAPALLRRGARVVIAGVREVPDDRVVDLMVDLHRGLASPARALADAQAKHGDMGFVCFGAG